MKAKIFNLQSALGFAITAFIVMATVSAAQAQNIYTFSSNSSIAIGDLAAANPYPSSIAVANVPYAVSRVTVKIKSFTHAYPDDVGIILVGPTGQKAYVFTDCLGDDGGDGVVNLDLTFDELAANPLPDNPLGGTPSGTYRPKKGTSDGFSPEHPANFAAPAPSGPYSETLSSFNNQNPNGTWHLFVDDDGAGDRGAIQNGWELSIYATPATASPAVISGTVTNSLGRPVRGATLTLTDQNNVIIGQVTTTAFGYYAFPAVPSNDTYFVALVAKGYTFSPSLQIISLSQDTTLNWWAAP